MRDNKTFIQLKELVNDYVKEGKILDNPVGRIGRKNLPEEINGFFKRFLDLLLYTNFISEESKRYIKEYYITIGDIVKELDEEQGVKTNTNAVKVKVWRDKKKITESFGEQMLSELLVYKDTKNLKEYNTILANLCRKFNRSSLLDTNVALDMPDTEVYLGEEMVTDSEFNEFIDIILPYTKNQMEYIASNIDKNTLAYCKYILDTNILNARDLERKERLLEILK